MNALIFSHFLHILCIYISNTSIIRSVKRFNKKSAVASAIKARNYFKNIAFVILPLFELFRFKNNKNATTSISRMSSNSQESTDSTESSPGGVPPSNSNIKKRLNMYVKRRIQKSADKRDGGEDISSNIVTSTTASPKTPKKAKNVLHQSTESIDDEFDPPSCYSPTSSRHSQDRTVDLLTMVLNHKKSSLLNDPEILMLIPK